MPTSPAVQPSLSGGGAGDGVAAQLTAFKFHVLKAKITKSALQYREQRRPFVLSQLSGLSSFPTYYTAIQKGKILRAICAGPVL